MVSKSSQSNLTNQRLLHFKYKYRTMEYKRNCKLENWYSGPNSRRKTNCHLHSRRYALKQINFNLRNYNGLFKEGRTSYRAHRGVAIFIHGTSPCQKLIINTALQAIAVRISIWRNVTIVFIYKSRSHAIIENLLSTLFQELPKPVTLTGNFNSYYQIWESPAYDNRGCQV